MFEVVSSRRVAVKPWAIETLLPIFLDGHRIFCIYVNVQCRTYPSQDCPTFSDLRKETWPNGTDLNTKLWGDYPNLARTVGFVTAAGLNV